MGIVANIASQKRFALYFFMVLSLSSNAVFVNAQPSTTGAEKLLEKGLALMNEAKFEQANSYLKRATGLYINAKKPVRAAHCYNHLSSNNRLMSNLGVARLQAQKALSLLEGVTLDDPTEKIRALTNLGLLAAIEADFEQSLQLLKKASALVRSPDVSPVLKMVVISSLGYLYDDLGQYDKALYYYNDALDILLAQSDPPKSRIAKLYNNMGVAYSNKGLYKQSRDYYRRELKLNLAAKGENHPDVAGAYLNIGNSYLYSGDVGEALLYFERAKRVIGNVYGRQHEMMVLVLNSLAKCEMKLGNYQKTIDYLNEAVAIKTRLVGENHPELAASYETMADAYAEVGKKQIARGYYLKAISVRKKSLPENHPDTATPYIALAKFLLNNGQPQKALVYLERARAILLASVGGRHPRLAETYAAMGRVHAQLGNVVESISIFQTALGVAAPAFNGVGASENPTADETAYPLIAVSVLTAKAQALCLLYETKNDKKFLSASLYTYYALSKLLDKQQWGYYQLNSKIAVARRSHKIYEQAIEAAYEMYEITGNRSFFQLVFYFSEKSKGRVLLEAVAHTNDKQLAGIPEDILQREQQLKHRLAQVKQALYNAGSNKSGKNLSAKRLKDSLFVLNRKISSFTRKLEERYPKYFRLKYNSEFPGLFTIQKKLERRNSTIIEYFYGKNSLYAIVIAPDFIHVEPLDFSTALNGKIRNFRRAIISADKQYLKQGNHLYSLLIKPVEPYIKAARSLLIVPGGPLRLLPFGALLTNNLKSAKGVAHHALPYLINNYNISYAISVALSTAMSRNGTSSYEMQFAGFAPVFAKSRGKKTLTSNARAAAWKTLSFSDYEVKTIAEQFNEEDSFWDFLPWKDKNNKKLFLREEATESNFKNGGYLSARYIHLATHAFTSNRVNRQTGIAFYQNGRIENGGILYASEIYNLQLQTQLVVLSACETGLGNIIPGEGLMGLSRAFQYAGANNLIVSLWKVGDRSTAGLMISFYEYLQMNYSMARALSAAKRGMISKRRYAHPRYWATFKLIGNGGK